MVTWLKKLIFSDHLVVSFDFCLVPDVRFTSHVLQVKVSVQLNSSNVMKVKKRASVEEGQNSHILVKYCVLKLNAFFLNFLSCF